MSELNNMTYGGRCNRGACLSKRPATYWNSSTRQFYCGVCAVLINSHVCNVREDGSPLCQWVPKALAEQPEDPIPKPPAPLKGPDRLSILDFWVYQRFWSYTTFGPPEFKGPKGPLDHLIKEALEAYKETDKAKQQTEIVDCLFLVFDAAHRAGLTFFDMIELAFNKLDINKARTWPNWRGTDPDRAIEHVRTGE